MLPVRRSEADKLSQISFLCPSLFLESNLFCPTTDFGTCNVVLDFSDIGCFHVLVIAFHLASSCAYRSKFIWQKLYLPDAEPRCLTEERLYMPSEITN